jgi:hypothetical protein
MEHAAAVREQYRKHADLGLVLTAGGGAGGNLVEAGGTGVGVAGTVTGLGGGRAAGLLVPPVAAAATAAPMVTLNPKP